MDTCCGLNRGWNSPCLSQIACYALRVEYGIEVEICKPWWNFRSWQSYWCLNLAGWSHRCTTKKSPICCVILKLDTESSSIYETNTERSGLNLSAFPVYLNILWMHEKWRQISHAVFIFCTQKYAKMEDSYLVFCLLLIIWAGVIV